MNRKRIVIALWAVALAAGASAIWLYVATYRYEKEAAALLSPSLSGGMDVRISSSTVDTSRWKTYKSSVFGFSFDYPSGWQSSGDPLNVANPHIFFGNPLNGTTTYRLDIFVYEDAGDMSATNYVTAMLASDTAEDIRSGAASGTAPRISPQFSRQFPLMVGGLPAYELYDVFEFDHQSEQIYVQDGTHMILFDFPVAETNPNISEPASNNRVAQAIIGTLRISSSSL